MLASLLPGLRDVRTPLAVGYLWLLFLWLALGRQLPLDRNALGGRAWDLYRFFGQGTFVAAISFIAFLLGSIVTVRSNSFSRLWMRATGKQDLDPEGKLFQFIVDTLEIKGIDVSGFAAMTDSLFPVEDLRARLLVANQEMYGEYDRLESEAVFRINIAPPLFAVSLAVILQSGANWWTSILFALVALLVVAILVAQGQGKNSLATEVLTQSILSGVIEHPIIVDRVTVEESKRDTERQHEVRALKSKHNRDLRAEALQTLTQSHERLRKVEVDLALTPKDDAEKRRSLVLEKSGLRKAVARAEESLNALFEAG
ncbi:hypothetical protein [Kribbella sp. VKM Ac-2566]|uniref:hypothetical protein n=1 Tax=Kribbella sp. VKM Ac-2566 TaxID=2512218 RepID=UPI001062501A|nr:hypothetical protein [Kribbella sp. VKM Ac-2566]